MKWITENTQNGDRERREAKISRKRNRKVEKDQHQASPPRMSDKLPVIPAALRL
jgi:hypothetical protein